MSAPRERIFKMEKVGEIQQIAEDQLLRPAGPRIADEGNLYFHYFERHLSYNINGNGKLVSTFAPRCRMKARRSSTVTVSRPVITRPFTPGQNPFLHRTGAICQSCAEQSVCRFSAGLQK